MEQILESGSPATTSLFTASQREPAWQSFVSGVPSCTKTATSGHTLSCLRRANSSDISEGLRTYLSIPSALNSFVFAPTLDGPNGFIPDYPSKLLAQGRLASVPFIAGTSLDEGEEIALFSSEVGTVSYLFALQELISPPRASSQRKKFTSSSSKASLRRSLLLLSSTTR